MDLDGKAKRERDRDVQDRKDVVKVTAKIVSVRTDTDLRNHPPVVVLNGAVHGIESPATTRAVDHHAQGCERCRRLAMALALAVANARLAASVVSRTVGVPVGSADLLVSALN